MKPTLRQPIGMRVTYPLVGYPGDTVRRFYRFSYDSNANSFNIQMIDSTLFDGFNPQLINEANKSYVFTLEQPKRLSAIQYSKYGAGGGYSDYNVNFDYISYGFDPSYIEMLILPGSNKLAYGDVSTVSVNWVGNRLDVLNCSHKYQVFHPKREDYWGPLDVRRYTDTSFEFIFNGVSMYSALFDDPVHFPDYTYIRFEGIYIFNPDNTCNTFAADLEDKDSGFVSGQHRFDFTYQQENKDLFNVYNSLYNVNTLIWEMATQEYYYTRGVDYHNDYATLDTYHPDLYRFFQNVCDSYTDSLFTVDNLSGIKTLVQADRYTNTIERDANGNISVLLKTNSKGVLFRKIEFYY